MTLENIKVVPLRSSDLAWATDVLEIGLGGRQQARRGEVIDVLWRVRPVLARSG